MEMTDTILRVSDLVTTFQIEKKDCAVVNGISFAIGKGETVGIVGESGCGKSVTSLSVMRLLSDSGRVRSGEIQFDGRDMLALKRSELDEIRGRDLSMIFQEPMTSLNPLFTVGRQISESVLLHTDLGRQQAWERAVEMLGMVGIANPGERANAYPHMLSGGMRQRVMIAMALACNPKLLIADEPTTALDVTVQAQILELIKSLRKQFDMAVMLITHDLGVISEMCERVIVMYAGDIVEESPVAALFENPLHPYTRGLIQSIPQIGPKKELLHTIPGFVPSLTDMPEGCRFAPRCGLAQDKCSAHKPEMRAPSPGRRVACHFAGEGENG